MVDEAHCIAEWGGEDFRPTYRSLETLRGYTGQEIPIIACTATCPTKTFDLIWTTLGYGFRPFWGLDVGSDRPNLLYITRWDRPESRWQHTQWEAVSKDDVTRSRRRRLHVDAQPLMAWPSNLPI